MTLDEAIAIAKRVYEDESVDARGRKDYGQIAEWLEELKQYREKNHETNLDHYRHEILEGGIWDLAVVKGKPKHCKNTSCSDCDFKDALTKGCHKKAMLWLIQPYKTPAIKLTKIEKDLLQSCTGKYMFKYIPVLCGMKEKGYFKGIDENETLEDILADCDITEED